MALVGICGFAIISFPAPARAPGLAPPGAIPVYRRSPKRGCRVDWCRHEGCRRGPYAGEAEPAIGLWHCNRVGDGAEHPLKQGDVGSCLRALVADLSSYLLTADLRRHTVLVLVCLPWLTCKTTVDAGQRGLKAQGGSGAVQYWTLLNQHNMQQQAGPQPTASTVHCVICSDAACPSSTRRVGLDEFRALLQLRQFVRQC